LDRVIPVIERVVREVGLPISIDTSKPGVMNEAVRAGAGMINDVNALRTPGALEQAVQLGVPVCLMHMQGEPRTMQTHPRYENVTAEVMAFLRQRIEACESAGIDPAKIVIDPGFGFGKSLDHNLTLLAQLADLQQLARPVLVGLSRKSMIAALLDGASVDQRLFGSLAAAVMAVERGARIIRVHDVKETVEALKVTSAVLEMQGSFN
jgi:dihydropteroate synthase